MKKINLNEGDVLTIETAAKRYKDGNDIAVVVVDGPGSSPELDLLNQVKEMSIFKVVKNDVHADMKKLNVDICHFSLRAIKIDSLVFDSDGKTAKVNGEFDVPLKTSTSGKMLETYFFSESLAHGLAASFNKVELEKMKDLVEAATKSLSTMTEIVENDYV